MRYLVNPAWRKKLLIPKSVNQSDPLLLSYVCFRLYLHGMAETVVKWQWYNVRTSQGKSSPGNMCMKW